MGVLERGLQGLQNRDYRTCMDQVVVEIYRCKVIPSYPLVTHSSPPSQQCATHPLAKFDGVKFGREPSHSIGHLIPKSQDIPLSLL